MAGEVAAPVAFVSPVALFSMDDPPTAPPEELPPTEGEGETAVCPMAPVGSVVRLVATVTAVSTVGVTVGVAVGLPVVGTLCETKVVMISVDRSWPDGVEAVLIPSVGVSFDASVAPPALGEVSWA